MPGRQFATRMQTFAAWSGAAGAGRVIGMQFFSKPYTTLHAPPYTIHHPTPPNTATFIISVAQRATIQLPHAGRSSRPPILEGLWLDWPTQ